MKQHADSGMLQSEHCFKDRPGISNLNATVEEGLGLFYAVGLIKMGGKQTSFISGLKHDSMHSNLSATRCYVGHMLFACKTSRAGSVQLV